MTRKPLTFRPQLEALEDRSLPSFLAPTNYAIGSQQAVAVGDFNNDNHPDIVTTEVGDMGTSRFNLLVGTVNRKGQSQGQFQWSSGGTSGTGGYSLAGGDSTATKTSTSWPPTCRGSR